MNPLIFDAIIFATNAHHNSKTPLRKYTKEPYIVHPLAVAKTVSQCKGATDNMIIAAILHDTVEDCEVSLLEIENKFGVGVSALVEMLTNVATLEDGKRSIRKKIDREHTAKAHPDAKTIKLADLIDNTKSIVAEDPKFAITYLEEKRLLLEVLEEGDSDLWNLAFKQVAEERVNSI